MKLHRLRAGVVVAAIGATIATAACGPTTSGQPTGASSATNAASDPHSITILGAGDVLLHPDLWQQAQADAAAHGEQGYDFGPLFDGVRSQIASADLAVCHVETAMATPTGPFHGFPTFNVPPQIAKNLADLGYDTCSTASNHTLDQGVAGIKRTLDALDAASVHHAGSYRTKADHDTVNMIDVKGVKIAQLSYAFGFNAFHRPAGREWIVNQIDKAAILAEAHRARAAGAAIVVVSLHWGTEYQHTPNKQQAALAKELMASPDIDLILGHHAHVVQPIEQINGKWVVYGMGNQVAHHDKPVNDNREGIMPTITFQETTPGHWTATKIVVTPVWMTLSPRDRLTNLATALADKDITASRRETYQAAFDRIRGYVLSRGAGEHGLTFDGS
jgi:poly-gamma-glutamate synthesis protein (capsule biosynthesis protein)